MTKPPRIHTQLGCLCDFLGGSSLPDGQPFVGQTDGYLLLKVGDMNLPGNEVLIAATREWTKAISRGATLCPPGSVVIPKRGGAIATNKKRLLMRDAMLDPNLMGMAPTSAALDAKYLLYWFQRFDLRTITSGSSVPQLNKRDLAPLPFALPAPSEQRRIVEILDQADALRKQRAETDVKVQRILPALFYKMFGDPSDNPKGWNVRPLGDAVVEMRYGTSVRCEEVAIGVPVLRIPNVVRGRLDLEKVKYVDLPESESERLMLEKGDVVFVRTNGNRDYVGRCAVFDLDEPYLFASYLIRGRFDQNELLPYFLTSYLSTGVGRSAMSPAIRTTAGQSNISTSGLRQIPVPRPPVDLQRDFERQLHDLRCLQHYQSDTADTISRLFDVLLHRAFTGELTATWREKHKATLAAETEEQRKLLETSAIESKANGSSPGRRRRATKGSKK